MFSKSIIVAAIAGLVSAAPLTRRDATGSFGLVSIRSGSPVHLLAISASENGFWLGKPTASDCPDSVGADCPPGDVTAFTYQNATTGLSMDVEVPGGQQVYVTPSGEFGYTIPHSAALPADAITTGWQYTPAASVNNVGTLSLGNGTQGFMACPTNGTVYQVLATNGTATGDCLGINLATVAYTGNSTFAAWEYA